MKKNQQGCELVQGRISQALACAVITLSEDEKKLYKGCGVHLGRFEEGVLIELRDVSDFCGMSASASEIHPPVAGQLTPKQVVLSALDWAYGYPSGKIWLVMCSCYELCEPVPILEGDMRGVLLLQRAFFDELIF